MRQDSPNLHAEIASGTARGQVSLQWGVQQVVAKREVRVSFSKATVQSDLVLASKTWVRRWWLLAIREQGIPTSQDGRR